MTYQQTLNYLYAQLPMFSKIGAAAYKKDLGNTIALCKALGNPQHSFKSIHVAGTNGKGSVSHMLAAVLANNGYKTGLYTSPHLTDFRERIKINGKFCSQKFVVDFVKENKAIIEKIQPSFFELTVAMAFSYFASKKVNFAIIETGLGGRLDSTNIINPILSVITNIGYDHTDILGNTLPQIAYEKAGIIKAKTPIIVSEVLLETREVFVTKAKQVKAPLTFVEDLYSIEKFGEEDDLLKVNLNNKVHAKTEIYCTDLRGFYQAKNVACVVSCLSLFKSLSIKTNEKKTIDALTNVQKLTGLAGRWQVIGKNPKIVLDVAHNVHGMQQVIQQLSKQTYKKLHIIIGMVKDKDISSVMALLPKTATYYFTNAQIPRALPFADLQSLAAQFGLKGKGFNHVNFALKAAKQKANSTDFILVCGSVFLVGEVDVKELTSKKNVQ